MEITKRYINTSQGQMHVRTTGKENGRSLLLLHQTASSAVMFEALMAELADSYWLIAPDTPGFGQSFVPAEPATMEMYATAVIECLQVLGVSSCCLFGHHTGAAIGVQMAYERADLVGKLALSGPPLLTEAQVEALMKGLQEMALDENGRFLTETWQRIQKKEIKAPLELIFRETLLALQTGSRYHEAYYAVFAQNFAAQLTSLTMPVLVMAGEHDSLRASLEPSFALLKNGTKQLVLNAGTFICDQKPKLLASILQNFFDTQNGEPIDNR